LSIFNQYAAAPIYHYGGYEPRVMAKLAKRYGTNAEDIHKRMIRHYQGW
jgi:predicted RecB family nuclease